MSIQTELTRLTNAKAAIQTAIEGKGVTVPSGTLLDGMAALIESIEAGGGFDIGKDFAYGMITPSENITENYTIEHGLGTMVAQALVFRTGVSTGTNSWTVLAYSLAGASPGISYTGVYNPAYNKVSRVTTKETTFQSIGTSSMTIFCDSSKSFQAGITYVWMVIGK